MVGNGWVDQWPEMKAKFEAEYPWIEVIEVGTGPEKGFLASRMAANDIPDIVSVDNTQVSYDAVDAGADSRPFRSGCNKEYPTGIP